MPTNSGTGGARLVPPLPNALQLAKMKTLTVNQYRGFRVKMVLTAAVMSSDIHQTYMYMIWINIKKNIHQTLTHEYEYEYMAKGMQKDKQSVSCLGGGI